MKVGPGCNVCQYLPVVLCVCLCMCICVRKNAHDVGDEMSGFESPKASDAGKRGAASFEDNDATGCPLNAIWHIGAAECGQHRAYGICIFLRRRHISNMRMHVLLPPQLDLLHPNTSANGCSYVALCVHNLSTLTCNCWSAAPSADHLNSST
eukprot:scaffold232269_cov26-Tisochrysis_lutea.AAC.1